MPGSVIVEEARAPIGELSGSLRGDGVGRVRDKAASGSAGIIGDQVDYVIVGHLMPALITQPANHIAAVAAAATGLP